MVGILALEDVKMENLKQDETEMIRISKDFALEGFCLLRQEERSLDHVLFDDWHELVCFYRGNREERILRYLDQINELTLRDTSNSVSRTEFENRLKPLPRLVGIFAARFQATESGCFVKQDEINLIASTLNRVVFLLSGNRPSDADIVQLRMDASLCQDLILMRCQTLPHLEKASRIENFDMPEYQRHYTIEEVLGDVPSKQQR